MSGYYPLGAEFDPRAPYNQPEPQEHEFDVEVTATLGCNTRITSFDALEIFCEDEDEDGYSSYLDTSNVNVYEDFREQFFSPTELIKMFRNLLLEHKEIKFGDRENVLRSTEIWLSGDEELEVEEC